MNTILPYFKALTANHPEAWFLTSLEGQIIAHNAAADNLLSGENRLEITNIATLFPAADFKNVISQCLQNGSSRQIIAAALPHEKNNLIQLTCCQVPDQEAYISWQLSNLDTLTEEEKKLQESQRLLLAAQEVAKVGTWKYDFQSKVLEWSPELFKIFGLEPHDAPPTLEKFWSVVHPEDYPSYFQLIQDTITNCSSYNVDHRIIRPGGSVGYLQCSGEVVVDETGIPALLFGMAMDITERKQTEENLKQALRTNEKILNNSLEIICTLNKNGHFETINQACKKIWGYTPSEIIAGSSSR